MFLFGGPSLLSEAWREARGQARLGCFGARAAGLGFVGEARARVEGSGVLAWRARFRGAERAAKLAVT